LLNPSPVSDLPGKPFSDYELICEIQVKNELDLGENYRNINGCKTFAVSIMTKAFGIFPTIYQEYKQKTSR
jgi:hypothetical protein